MKTLMILGAGIYQVPLIKKARAMGLRTLVVSIPGPYPGFAEADNVLYLDTRDGDGILSAARSERIDGIMTTGTDVAVRAIGRVCDALGLPGISAEAARTVTDKALMKEAFRRGGVPTADFRIVRCESEAFDAAEAIGYPVMVKACDVSGSRGISRVDGPEGIPEAWRHAAAATHTDHLIVERMTQGVEIGLDGFVRDGRIVLCLPHEKCVGRTDRTTVPIGHRFPFEGSEALKTAIRQAFEAIVASCGLNNCAVNADVFVTGRDTVSVIEAGGRCGATTIPELITRHTGIDYYEAMIRCALGEPAAMQPLTAEPCVGRLLMSPVNGTITAVDTARLDALAAHGVSVSLDYGVGDHVETMKNGTDRIGQLIVSGADCDRVEALAAEAAACLTIREDVPY